MKYSTLQKNGALKIGKCRNKMTSEEFRKKRKEIGLTQKELGQLIGRTQNNVSDIERGKHKPTKIQSAFIRYIFEHR